VSTTPSGAYIVMPPPLTTTAGTISTGTLTPAPKKPRPRPRAKKAKAKADNPCGVAVRDAAGDLYVEDYAYLPGALGPEYQCLVLTRAEDLHYEVELVCAGRRQKTLRDPLVEAAVALVDLTDCDPLRVALLEVLLRSWERELQQKLAAEAEAALEKQARRRAWTGRRRGLYAEHDPEVGF
jgi:hypothetical protein